MIFIFIYIYIYIYPPPRFARRREWELNTKHPSPGPCACPYPSPLPLPLPSSSGVWSVLKNLDLGGRTIHPPGWPRHGLTPPRTFQNHWKIVSFLNPFSNAFLDRFLVHFASQLASQNPLKCVKNRCQDAFHLGLHVWIDFWLIFAPNLDPLNPIWH